MEARSFDSAELFVLWFTLRLQPKSLSCVRCELQEPESPWFGLFRFSGFIAALI
jgi:hypothetical protein